MPSTAGPLAGMPASSQSWPLAALPRERPNRSRSDSMHFAHDMRAAATAALKSSVSTAMVSICCLLETSGRDAVRR